MNPNDKNLNIEVWDWDAIGSDDFLGVCDISLADIVSGTKNVVSGWFALQQSPKKPNVKVTGEVNVKISAKSMKAQSKGGSISNKEVERKVKEAKQQGSTSLMLSSMGIKELPSIGDLTGLEEAHLSLNNLNEFPTKALTRNGNTLKMINLAGNAITMVPDQVGVFNALTELSLNGNQITTISPEIGRLASLEKLNLANNSISQLPKTIGYLKNLDELNLSGNQIENVPDAIGNLFKLEILDLSCNNIKFLPEEFTYLTRIIELNLGSNSLVALPEAIGRLSRVVNINIADNNITQLPASLGYCVGLKQIGQGLNIERNPLRDPELEKQYKIGADRLFIYLERMLS